MANVTYQEFLDLEKNYERVLQERDKYREQLREVRKQKDKFYVYRDYGSEGQELTLTPFDTLPDAQRHADELYQGIDIVILCASANVLSEIFKRSGSSDWYGVSGDD